MLKDFEFMNNFRVDFFLVILVEYRGLFCWLRYLREKDSCFLIGE